MPPKAIKTPSLAHVSHRSKGRIRFRVPSKKGDSGFFNMVKEKLQKNDRIIAVDVNPVTGSILIFYNSDESEEAALLKAVQAGTALKVEKERPPQKHPRRHVAHSVKTGFRSFDGWLKSLTGGQVDLGTAAFVALVGLGIYQMRKGRFALPSWHVAFWYALNIFLRTETEEPATGVV